MKKLTLYISLFTLAFFTAQAQPAPKQSESILITNAIIHTGTLQVIESGAVGFDNGKITYVGAANSAPKNSFKKVIDAKGSHIYPGFIATNSTLGLLEIDAVKASDDMAEIGKYNPNVRSIIAFNTESKVIETAKQNGILLAQITPRDGRISGKSSIVNLDSWHWREAVINEDEGLHINFPRTFGRDWSDGSGKLSVAKDYDKQVTELENYLKTGIAYQNQTNEQENEPYFAIANWFKNGGTLYIHANEAQQMTDAVLMANRLNIKKIVLVGASDADQITDLLKKYRVSVLIERVHSLISHDTDPVEKPYAMPAILRKAGIIVALENSSEMERMNTRNLPFMAGTAAGFGLSKEEALQLITLHAAKILGIDNQYGSLEVGKSATLLVSTGDALDMRGNNITQAFIDGRSIDLQTHQTKLYEKYKTKYQQ